MASRGQIGERRSRKFWRREQIIREERESFRKNEEKWVFGYRDSENWNNKLRITCLSFSGGVKVTVSHTV